MKNVIVRSLSGIVYIALIVGAIFWGQIPFYVLTALFAILGTHEFNKISHKDDESKGGLWAIDSIFAALITLSAFFDDLPNITLYIIGLYILIRCSLALSSHNADAFVSVAKSILGVMYLSVPLYLLNTLYSKGLGELLVLVTFIMIWLNDTGAFCFGITMGKHKMCERLSPKKTWEGFWGGMFCCILFAVIFSTVVNFSIHPFYVILCILLGAVVSVFSTLGDLFESMLKRTFGVKDSGHIIPGHGGILDRIDSLLFVSIAVNIVFMVMSYVR